MLVRACGYCAANASSISPVFTIAQSSLTSCHTTEARHTGRQFRASRRHATTASNGSSREYSWPETPRGQTCPTPYQILSTSRAETYSKAEFYRLVKLYHPDRGSLGHLQPTIPAPVRLERYRLIVAAHTLLSDPGKRSAYDRLGVGWHGKSELTTANGYRPFDHNWQDSVWANATWEDWEKWHARQAARERGEEMPQEPLYMSNSAFISIVVALILCGSIMNFGRAQTTGQFIMEQRDAMHSGASKELRKVRREKKVMDERDQRVDWFVRHRDATLGVATGEVQEMRENVADRMLASGREVCHSEDIASEELG